MTDILLISRGVLHPTLRARRLLRAALSTGGSIRLHEINSIEKLPPDLERYAAVVLYFHQKEISESALTRLEEYVASGGGLLGVHSATASFKQQPRYHRLLGGRFTGHGAIKPFAVVPCGDEGIFSGLSPFTIRDELYFHDLQPDINAHFCSWAESGAVPVVWTRQQGQGRVCYVMFGHTISAIRDESVRQVLQRGLDWVSAR
jgi:type 1 glutamine amidotransferase